MNFDELVVGAFIGMLVGAVLSALVISFSGPSDGNPCQTPTQQN